ncbi:ATP-dependent DNA helicase, partial [Nanoarchaeota archaeon]
MKLWELPIPERLKLTFPNLELRPPQVQAIQKGVLEGRNVVVSSPTASGKTLIAELAGVKNILEGKGKMLYIVPLKSIANEKYKEFRERYDYLKVALSIGDYDSSDPWLEKYDIIITTSEKMDSLIRHRAFWVRDVGTLVVDEIHLINDLSRGPT